MSLVIGVTVRSGPKKSITSPIPSIMFGKAMTDTFLATFPGLADSLYHVVSRYGNVYNGNPVQPTGMFSLKVIGGAAS